MAVSLEEIRRLLPEVRGELFRKPNVIGTGVGYKVVEGRQTEELAIICSVQTKKARKDLTSKEVIPPAVQNIRTDVFLTGIICALEDPTERFRPAPGGVSIGHHLITAGTLGCLVERGDKTYILSNNHVLANSNDASIGDPILQPGPHDGGTHPLDHIASLSEFVAIEFEGGNSSCPVGQAIAAIFNGLAKITGSKTRVRLVRKAAAANLVDCAIAEPLDPGDVKNEILHIGAVSEITEGTLSMSVKKSGRTTGFTEGKIDQIDVTVRVSYGPDRVATFTDQLMAGGMSQGGDSGSAVVSSDDKLVGLLFAGSPTTTVINRIQNVFQALQVTLP